MNYCVHFIEKDQHILLLKRKDSNPFYPGIWTPIIGKLKANEEPLKAVIRETFEETQLTVTEHIFLKHCKHKDDDYWFYHSSTSQSEIVLNHENDAYDFFSKDNLPENLWSFFKITLSEI